MSNRARGHGRIRTAVAALAATLMTVGLASCTPGAAQAGPSGTPSQSTPPTPTSTPTPTQTPTTPGTISALADGVKPTRPAALDTAADLEGAQAVLGYWIQLLTYAQQVGDTTETKQLSHPDCVYCASMNGAIDDLIARGGHSQGGAVAVSDLSGSEVTPGKWFAINLTLVEEPSREVTASGLVTKSYDERKTYAIDAAVIYESGAWLIREVSYEVVARETPPLSAP